MYQSGSTWNFWNLASKRLYSHSEPEITEYIDQYLATRGATLPHLPNLNLNLWEAEE